jgi:hypothetical protein
MAARVACIAHAIELLQDWPKTAALTRGILSSVRQDAHEALHPKAHRIFAVRAERAGTPCANLTRMKHAISWFAVALVTIACGGNDKPAEGPAERSGEKMDEAADDVERKAEEAGDKVEEAGDKVEEKVEKERKEE